MSEADRTTITYRQAVPADLPAIEALLVAAALTMAGVADHLTGFLLASDGATVVACAGLEIYGGTALLRSVVVDAAYLNRGVARRLVRAMLERAAAHRVTEVYLLTTTAAEYFRRFGFRPIAREEVAASVQASKEFGDSCCASAQAMRLRVNASKEV